MAFKKGNIPWIKTHGHSKETRAKISKSHMGLQVGEKNPMFGKPSPHRKEPNYSEETKQKIKEFLIKNHPDMELSDRNINKVKICDICGDPKEPHHYQNNHFKVNGGCFSKGSKPWNTGLTESGMTGKVAWNKDISQTEETKAKISKSCKGINLGRVHSEETKLKLSNIKKGLPNYKIRGDNNSSKRPEVRLKISEAQRGEKHWNFGKHRSDETISKLSGEKCHLWRGVFLLNLTALNLVGRRKKK